MKVRILPDGLDLEVSAGTNLLEAVTNAGIALDASCGGMGVCGQCRVKLVSGDLQSEQGARLTQEDLDEGWRQACQSEVVSDVVIEIPDESRIDDEVIFERRVTPSGQYLTEEMIEALNSGWEFDPPLRKIFLKLPPPTADDNISDMARLSRSLRGERGIKQLRIDIEALRSLPVALREGKWEVTVTLLLVRASEALLDKGEKTPHQPVLIRVEAGDTTDPRLFPTVSGRIEELRKQRGK